MITKGIVLAAGKGTRLLPLTLAMPKEMIRVGTKPVIEHAIEVLRAGEIKDILVVVGRKKEAIMDYLGSGERLGVDISYKIQEELKGTAHAVFLGRKFVGVDDFAVIYGDNYLRPHETIKYVVKFHEEKRADTTLVLYPVKDPRRFGIVKINKYNQVLDMIEKPSLKEARPYKTGGIYLSIAGLLLLNPSVFGYIGKTKPGKDGEIWLTDSVDLMRKDGKAIYGFRFEGTRYDLGTFDSLRKADELEQKEKFRKAR